MNDEKATIWTSIGRFEIGMGTLVFVYATLSPMIGRFFPILEPDALYGLWPVLLLMLGPIMMLGGSFAAEVLAVAYPRPCSSRCLDRGDRLSAYLTDDFHGAVQAAGRQISRTLVCRKAPMCHGFGPGLPLAARSR